MNDGVSRSRSVDEGIERKYEDAAESVPYESAEGGYQWPLYDVRDVLCDVEMIFDDACLGKDRDLSEVVLESSKYNTVPLIEQCLIGSDEYVTNWEHFCAIIKHSSRFTAFMGFSGLMDRQLSGAPLSDVTQYDRQTILLKRNDVEEITSNVSPGPCLANVGEGTALTLARREQPTLGLRSRLELRLHPFLAPLDVDPHEISHSHCCQAPQPNRKGIRPHRRALAPGIIRRTVEV